MHLELQVLFENYSEFPMFLSVKEVQYMVEKILNIYRVIVKIAKNRINIKLSRKGYFLFPPF